MSKEMFEVALGVVEPWFVTDVDFQEAEKTLTIRVDFRPGSRFAVPGTEGVYPVHDTVSKRYRHLNFFQHECFLEVRVPRVRLPNGSVRQVTPPWAGELPDFTQLFEALVLMLAQQMPFRAVGRIVGLNRHRVMALCERYVDLALKQADLSEVRYLVVDETSRAKGHDYLTLAATTHPRGTTRTGRSLLAQLTTKRTARAWLYREQLRAILNRKQIHVVRRLLLQWCTKVMHSKVEPMKAIAKMIRRHLDGIVAWARTRQTNSFIEALNGLFQAAKRKARGYKRLATARTVIRALKEAMLYEAILSYNWVCRTLA